MHICFLWQQTEVSVILFPRKLTRTKEKESLKTDIEETVRTQRTWSFNNIYCFQQFFLLRSGWWDSHSFEMIISAGNPGKILGRNYDKKIRINHWISFWNSFHWCIYFLKSPIDFQQFIQYFPLSALTELWKNLVFISPSLSHCSLLFYFQKVSSSM